ncbi:peptidylprolyl isomerase [Flavobacteriaceae bacterium]|nr:peptidylprolyl isomerase [Flavobacteriaceae bacterium]
MAILSKIRERSWLLIVIIGMALFAFVASPQDIMDFFNSSKVNSVGSVNGDPISREEFAAQVEAYKANTGNRSSQLQAVNAVWNSLVSERLYSEQLEKAGIVIGEKDVWDAIVQIPSIQNNPMFQNEIGFFDENRLKEYLATIKLDSDAGDIDAQNAWFNWLQTERNVKRNLEQTAYAFMLNQGVGASLKEGEQKYLDENTLIDAKYVYVPFSSVDSKEVKVSKSEISSYIAEHAAAFEVDASRDIEYVKFDLKATEADELVISNELEGLINDSEQYDSATKQTVVVKGFATTNNVELFIEENGSDLPVDENFYFKNTLARAASDEIFAAQVGDVVGPYKDNGYYKISKLVERVQMPDSARASHILIPYIGSRGNSPVLTKEQAKAQADSLAAVVRRSPSKMSGLAATYSSDLSNSEDGGDLDWFGYNRMVPEFRDFCFSNPTGSVGVVETMFGYHVIKLTGRKNVQPAVKIATIARKITASEATENTLFEQAETFAFELSEGADFRELAEEKAYGVLPANNLSPLTERITVLGPSRQIVKWAFEEDTDLGDTQRFDLDNGTYVVAVLKTKTAAGLMPVEKAVNRVRPIIEKEKKAELIKAKFSGATLADVSNSVNDPIRNVTGMTMAGPTIAGIGREVAVVGAMAGAPLNEVISPIVGSNGVFAIMVTARTTPEPLPNYETLRSQLVSRNEGRFTQVYEALEEAADITDNRAEFY